MFLLKGARMLIACWSVKGGAGTTVVAAALAVLLARAAPHGVLLVDLGGDAAALFGHDPPAQGVSDWLGAGPSVSPDSLRALEVATGVGVQLLGPGSVLPEAAPLLETPSQSIHKSASAEGNRCRCRDGDLRRLVEVLEADTRPIVVDMGPAYNPLGSCDAVHKAATKSILVIRPCYLAVRRAVSGNRRPSAVVVIDEPGRALRIDDIEEVLGVPVCARLDLDPAVARGVDSGLFGSRLPRSLERGLRHVA